jgi:hypothetical protein
MGPLRVWPGGLAISRTIGDRAAAEGGVMAEPEVSQVVVPEDVGVRLIAASDGLWDALTIKVRATDQPLSLSWTSLVEFSSVEKGTLKKSPYIQAETQGGHVAGRSVCLYRTHTRTTAYEENSLFCCSSELP